MSKKSNENDCGCIFCEDGKAVFVQSGVVTVQLSVLSPSGPLKVDKPVNWFKCKLCDKKFYKFNSVVKFPRGNQKSITQDDIEKNLMRESKNV